MKKFLKDLKEKDMKYIRTKDWVYPCETFKDYDGIQECIKNRDENTWCRRDYFEKKNEIIAESDTIEELCDWFAFEDAFDAKMFGPSLFGSVSLARLYAEKKIRKVVGYIVIEKKGVKTLEPVMKTNEKGEFELL